MTNTSSSECVSGSIQIVADEGLLDVCNGFALQWTVHQGEPKPSQLHLEGAPCGSSDDSVCDGGMDGASRLAESQQRDRDPAARSLPRPGFLDFNMRSFVQNEVK